MFENYRKFGFKANRKMKSLCINFIFSLGISLVKKEAQSIIRKLPYY